MQRRTIQILSIVLFVLTLVWGTVALLAYLGVPYHTAVYLDNAGQAAVNGACAADSLLCRGLYALFPFLGRSITRLAPFLGFGIVCIVLYALFLGWKGLSTGRFSFTMLWRPWKFLLFFLALLWLLFTALSQGTTDDMPVRRVVEPLAQVYDKLGPDALSELQANFKELQDGKCLTRIGQYQNGANVFLLKNSCIQKSFVTRVLSQALFLAILVLELLTLGSIGLWLLRIRPKSLPLEALLSIGVGCCIAIVVLWSLAVVKVLTPTSAWVLAVAIPVAGYRFLLSWIRALHTASHRMDEPWYSPRILLTWLLLLFLALNFLSVVRPFPIGWDDLGSYLNRPRLLASYGEFIFSMSQFQWEYVTSLAYLLFGYTTTFGQTAAMMINWLAGPLAVFGIYVFTRLFLKEGWGILAALLYYALPMVGHFSFADMKIDNAVFLFGTLAVITLFTVLFDRDDAGEESEVRVSSQKSWYLLAGIYIGFAFSMKATSVMVLMALAAVLLGVLFHWTAAFAVLSFAFAIFARQGVLDASALASRILNNPEAWSQAGLLLGFLALGLVLLAVAFFFGRMHWKRAAGASFLCIAGFLLATVPWIYHNNILIDRRFPPRLELKASNNISPIMDITGERADQEELGRDIRSLPEDLRVDTTNAACTSTAKTEELDRYWGYRKGWSHYLTLPWRTALNIDSSGYYVTTTFLLLLAPLILLLPAFWQEKQRWLRWLTLFTSFLLLQWVLFGNGIPWYGIGMFLGLVVMIETLLIKSPDSLNRIAMGCFVALGLLGMIAMRAWQFEQQRNVLEYAFGKVTATALEERTIPYYDDISRIVVERHDLMPDRPYLYRMGTFIPYFIPRNLEIIGVTDHQLDLFNCIYQERNAELTVKRLKALGFNSMVFDTNTATIERDQQGSLHQKVNAFVEFVNSGVGIQVPVNDPAAGVAFILLP